MAESQQSSKKGKAALDVELRAALDEARAAGIAAAREFVKRLNARRLTQMASSATPLAEPISK